jgi:nucleoside-diphosphate-sugar epimerase
VSAGISPRPALSLGRTLVTGADGFIGTHVSQTFAAQGIEVTGLTRRSDAPALKGVTPAYTSDLRDRDAIRRALHGVQCVVHLAGRVHARREGLHDPASECQRVNVEGTRLLLEECVSAGVSRFVFISSVKAVAESSDVELDETTPPLPGDAYGESKLEAERLVRIVALREGMHAPILRLPLVYGPGIKSNMVRMFSAVDRGFPLPFASIRNRRSFAHVGNVVEAIAAVLRTPAAGTETFFVSDGSDLSTPELIRRIARSLGRSPRLFAVPLGALRAAGGTLLLLSRITRFHFTQDSLTALIGSLFVDTSKIRQMTGYSAPVSVDEGLAQTATWLRSRKHSGAE